MSLDALRLARLVYGVAPRPHAYRETLRQNWRVQVWCICGAPFLHELTEREQQARFERECHDRHHDGEMRLILCDGCMAKFRRSMGDS